MCSAGREGCQTGKREADERAKEARGCLGIEGCQRGVQSTGERVRGEEREKEGDRVGQRAYSQENKRFEGGLDSRGRDCE